MEQLTDAQLVAKLANLSAGDWVATKVYAKVAPMVVTMVERKGAKMV